MDRVGIGVIGLGKMGSRHARNIAGRIVGARLVAVADLDEHRAQEIAGELCVPQAIRDYRELLAVPGVDAVVIAAPAAAREEMIGACVRARKHVFCEKPLALNLEVAERISDCVAGSGAVFQMGFMRRFDPAYVEAKKLIHSGAIGKPVLFRAMSRDPEGESLEYMRTSGGVFVDSSIHDFDLARWLMEDEVVQVYCAGGLHFYPEYGTAGEVDTALVTLTFRQGALGMVETTCHSGYGYDIRTEILGTEGALEVGYLRHHPVALLKAGRGSYDCVPGFLERFADAYVQEMQIFVEAVLQGKDAPVTFEEGVEAMRIAVAARASLVRGEPVTVERQQPAA